MEDYFFIEGEKIEKRQSFSSSSGYANFLNFVVEAKDKVQPSGFFVTFYDLQRIASGSVSVLHFNPDYDSWERGQRSRASIELPPDILKIKIRQ